MANTTQPAPTIDRSIHFYRADLGIKNGKPVELKLEPYLKTLAKLPFSDGSKRYQLDSNGDALSVWFDSDSAGPWDRFSWAGVRRSSLPRVELDGRLTALPIAARQGLHEATHVRLFADNVIGVEFNFYAPRLTRFPAFLVGALGKAPAFTVEPLLRQDIMDELKKRGEIRVLDLQIRRSYADTLALASKSLGAALQAVKSASNAEVIGITLRPEKYGTHPLSSSVVEAIRTIAGRDDLRQNATHFSIKGLNSESGKIDTLDLLQDQLITSKAILTVGGKSRAVKSDSAYAAIGEAYEDLKSELKAASAATLAQVAP